MADDERDGRWCTDGKFFRSGGERVWMMAVTYGPFPGGWPDSFEEDFSRIAAAGFRALRLFEMPEPAFLDVVPIRFGVAEPEGHYHVPLVATPWSFQTYRGS